MLNLDKSTCLNFLIKNDLHTLKKSKTKQTEHRKELKKLLESNTFDCLLEINNYKYV